MNKSARGFGIVEIVIGVVIVAIIVFGVLFVYNAQKAEPAGAPSSSSQVPATPIENEQDLSQTEQSLQSQDIDGQLDTKEIDQAFSQSSN